MSKGRMHARLSSGTSMMPRFFSWYSSALKENMPCTTFVRSRQSMQFVRNTPVCISTGCARPICRKYLFDRGHV